MTKRKREADMDALSTAVENANSRVVKTSTVQAEKIEQVAISSNDEVIQIVAGSYERVLHGITASISLISSSSKPPSVRFADTFLFNAHASAIRCLAISPLPNLTSVETQGVFVASGGSDEKINVYSLSATPPVESSKVPAMPLLGNTKVSENPRNRELGSLLQHSSTVSALHFPTRSKLLSASEDNTIAISRTKDLTVISTVKAPNPKAPGQASGDNTLSAAVPAGVNDFAVHPSMKLMVSVGKGEKCMRLWNLVTGKKAGVLNFGREVLQNVKEGKHSSGEGRRIRWQPDGSEFAVAFEKGVVLYGADSKPRRTVLPSPLTKLHQIKYTSVRSGQDGAKFLLAVSTEDGRVIFYDTNNTRPAAPEDTSNPLRLAVPVAQIDGKEVGISGRVKDFEILDRSGLDPAPTGKMLVTASSDGSIRLWSISEQELLAGEAVVVPHVGILEGTYETGNRITCLSAFVMLPGRPEEGLSEFEKLTEGEGESNESESE